MANSLIILCGIQASGKTSFYVDHFLHSHTRISQDCLKTSNRTRSLFLNALALRADIVVDRVNVTAADRAFYIQCAQAMGEYKIEAYWIDKSLDHCILDNAQRPDDLQVPEEGIRGTSAALEFPVASEGFKTIWRVTETNRSVRWQIQLDDEGMTQ